MAKPQVMIAFHAGEPFGATLDAAREQSAEQGLRASAPFESTAVGPLFAAIAKAANAVGVTCYVAATNDRLLAGLADVAGRKAMIDGVSRQRLVPAPTAGNGAELKLLAPLEIADEVRMNFDLWRRAIFTSPVSKLPNVEQTVVTVTGDPAAEVTGLTFRNTALIVVDVAQVDRCGNVEAALLKFVNALTARKDIQLIAAASQPQGGFDRMLSEVLTSGARAQVVALGAPSEYDSARAAFPLELARLLAPTSLAARALASRANDLQTRPLVLGAIDVKFVRGLLLRKLASGFSAGSGIDELERMRASFTIAHALLERLAVEKPDEKIGAHEMQLALEIPANLERVIDRVAKNARGEAPEASLLEAKKLKTRSVRALPKADEDPITRAEFLAAVKKAALAAAQCTEELITAVRTQGIAPLQKCGTTA